MDGVVGSVLDTAPEPELYTSDVQYANEPSDSVVPSGLKVL
jgi:hypothetical protein